MNTSQESLLKWKYEEIKKAKTHARELLKNPEWLEKQKKRHAEMTKRTPQQKNS